VNGGTRLYRALGPYLAAAATDDPAHKGVDGVMLLHTKLDPGPGAAGGEFPYIAKKISQGHLQNRWAAAVSQIFGDTDIDGAIRVASSKIVHYGMRQGAQVDLH
jgi:hypothetical protein